MPLNLPDSPRKIVFRTLIALLQADPDLARTIRPNSWFVWSGKPTDAAPVPAQALCPLARITPFALPASPEAESLQNAPLAIDIYLATWGLNVDDLLDLWSAFERAVFKGDGVKDWRIATQAALAASPGCVGSSIQTLKLGLPAIQPGGDDQEYKFMTATGTLVVQMTVPK